MMPNTPMSRHNGLALMKLIIAIAIIGLVSAVAVPKCFNLTKQTKALVAITKALTAANKNNDTIRKMNSSLGREVKNCTDVGNVLQGGLPTGYAIQPANVPQNVTVTCKITGPSNKVATFKATGII